MAGATKAAQAKENKVEFGLRNCYYAVVTVDESGKITYGAPKKLPGAVSITFDKSGDLIRFKADDIDYYTNANNQGYEGTLTLARVPEDFRTEVLKEKKTEKGVLIENSDAQTANIALMFEFQGDVKATRHLLYYCSVNRPSVGSTTKDSGDPNTTELAMVASPRPSDNLVKASTSAGVDEETYNSWYTKVYEEAGEAA
nr:MAG TPA: tail tube protein [Bacteriophage sp.]